MWCLTYSKKRVAKTESPCGVKRVPWSRTDKFSYRYSMLCALPSCTWATEDHEGAFLAVMGYVVLFPAEIVCLVNIIEVRSGFFCQAPLALNVSTRHSLGNEGDGGISNVRRGKCRRGRGYDLKVSMVRRSKNASAVVVFLVEVYNLECFSWVFTMKVVEGFHI